jgi:DNA-binding PadR family transcriptional regulator
MNRQAIPPMGSAADELARGRKFSSKELQLLLLALLSDEPRHGYQLTKQIEARSNGCYTPSAGMVYPALSHLEAAGLAQALPSGKRKGYRLTEAGRREVEASRDAVELLWIKLDFLGRKMALARRAFAAEDALSARNTPISSQSVLTAAFEKLKTAVLGAEAGSPAAQPQLVAVLERAAEEIAAIK